MEIETASLKYVEQGRAELVYCRVHESINLYISLCLRKETMSDQL